MAIASARGKLMAVIGDEVSKSDLGVFLGFFAFL